MYPFASPMMMGQAAGGAGAVTTWNPADKGTDVALSGGNLIARGGGSPGATRSTTKKSTGLWYAEVKAIGDAFGAVGVATSGPSNSSNLVLASGTAVYTAGGYFYKDGSGTEGYPTIQKGDVIGVALNANARSVAFYRNGALVGSISGLATSDLFIACQVIATDQVQQLNCGQLPFAYPMPSGYLAWG